MHQGGERHPGQVLGDPHRPIPGAAPRPIGDGHKRYPQIMEGFRRGPQPSLRLIVSRRHEFHRERNPPRRGTGNHVGNRPLVPGGSRLGKWLLCHGLE